MRQDTFTNTMAFLTEYYKKDLSDALFQVYWRALKHLPDSNFEKAVQDHMVSSSFFPKINELLTNEPKPLALENKGSLTWCANTQKLLDEYGLNRGVHVAA